MEDRTKQHNREEKIHLINNMPRSVFPVSTGALDYITTTRCRTHPCYALVIAIQNIHKGQGNLMWMHV